MASRPRGEFGKGIQSQTITMIPVSTSHSTDEERLGVLAMNFRGTRDLSERRRIAEGYCETVERLIRSGKWHEMPPPEDWLPDDWMPVGFFEYWLQQSDPA